MRVTTTRVTKTKTSIEPDLKNYQTSSNLIQRHPWQTGDHLNQKEDSDSNNKPFQRDNSPHNEYQKSHTNISGKNRQKLLKFNITNFSIYYKDRRYMVHYVHVCIAQNFCLFLILRFPQLVKLETFLNIPCIIYIQLYVISC